MRSADGWHPLVAIVYADGPAFEAALDMAAKALAAEGIRLAGLLQHRRSESGASTCDVDLEDLATGARYGIFDDRGSHARGCKLNTDKLLRACRSAEAALSAETDLLVLSKFGKTEVEGGGVRTLIVAALDLSVPVAIGVPGTNLPSFRHFADGLAREIDFAEIGPAGLLELMKRSVRSIAQEATRSI
jgi:hypothetical protein